MAIPSSSSSVSCLQHSLIVSLIGLPFASPLSNSMHGRETQPREVRWRMQNGCGIIARDRRDRTRSMRESLTSQCGLALLEKHPHAARTAVLKKLHSEQKTGAGALGTKTKKASTVADLKQHHNRDDIKKHATGHDSPGLALASSCSIPSPRCMDWCSRSSKGASPAFPPRSLPAGRTTSPP